MPSPGVCNAIFTCSHRLEQESRTLHAHLRRYLVGPREQRMKIESYPLVINTFGRLDGITSFLEVLDRTLPELEWVDKKALEKKAKDEDWEFPDFEGERQILDAKFKF